MRSVLPPQRNLVRVGLAAIVSAACIFFLYTGIPKLRWSAWSHVGTLGSLSICQLPTGEKVIWGLHYREPKPPGSKELGIAEVGIVHDNPSGPFGRCVQPFEITVICMPFGGDSPDFAAYFADWTFVEKHATCMDSAWLHRIAKEMPKLVPVVEGLGDPAYRGRTVRHYRGELIVWQAVVKTAFRPVLCGILALCVILVVRWTRIELRRHRETCDACGYDLRGLPPGSPCPECGRSR